MGVMLLCPGQGSQHPGMFDRLKDEPAARPVLEVASQHLGTDIAGPADGLDFADNHVAQLLLTAYCLAVRAVLGEAIGTIAIGYSVGEIAAIACAGCLDTKAAFDLIDARVRCMDDAVHASGAAQGLLAVIGLPRDKAAALAEAAGAAIAIVNGPDHLVLGGPAVVLDRLAPELEAKGARAVKRLPVRVASHTRFIAAATPAFAQVLERALFQPARLIVLSGIDGRVIRSHEDAVAALSEQLSTPLDFQRCLTLAGERGPSCALEIGPGHSLTRLAADILPGLPTRPFEDFRSRQGVLDWIDRHD